ncbi:putative U3 small nucleolar RNA-associated protein 14-like protein A [Hypsibius exemplaris]|uniref:U3 small nucleolar RNA-associated protein 14-like protein A n=1 Tax=Hypsibius exemplaris TaxID=2072580 RepID=A0A1W0XD05_HYPEX|nr:putative U3 small nucleolar RNA-associated protein 14-like protein A [Hypsibius exemplaris]
MASLLAPVHLEELPAGEGEYFGDIDDPEENAAVTRSPADKRQHEKLLRSIARLDKPIAAQKKIQRSEPAKTIGDQDVSVGERKSLSVSALLKCAGSSKSDRAGKKKLLAEKVPTVLAEPLRKLDAAKAQRTVAYEEVSKDLKKWDPIVKANRVAEGVSFPLDQTKLNIQTASEYVKRYQTQTPLEKEIADLVNSSRNNFTKATILTEAEREALSAMSVQEAEFRRQELQKTRALLSYKEQKSRWQSKIKSKGYHRHLRRAQRKIDEKEFDELQKNDPDAALDKLEGLDKQRIKERLTLKHRSMGKWARHTASRSKNDKSAREALQEQLRLSRSLATKLKPVESDSENDVEVRQAVEVDVVGNEKTFDEEAKINPWMSSAAAAADDWEDDPIDTAFESLEIQEERKEKEAKKPTKKATKKQKPLANRSRPQPRKSAGRRQSSESGDDSPVEVELVDGGELIVDTPNVQSGAPAGVSQQHQKHPVAAADIDVDPSNVIQSSRNKVHKSVIPSRLEDMEADNEDAESDSEEAQRNVVAEAFADDDVVEEFNREKQDVEEKDKPKDIDLTLPGWGDWAGAGLGVNAKKRKKFTVKAPNAKPRKDRFLPNVIISERHDEKIIPHQIRELPFPFTTVAQLQSTIRAPIGKTWNTEAAFDEMTKPKYTTKTGVVIQPINPRIALKKNKRKAGDFVGDGDAARTTALAVSEVVDAEKKTGRVSKRRKTLH